MASDRTSQPNSGRPGRRTAGVADNEAVEQLVPHCHDSLHQPHNSNNHHNGCDHVSCLDSTNPRSAHQLTLLPILRLYTRTDLNGTYLGIWLAHTGFGLPLAIYLLYDHISSIPAEIIESAYVDGSTPMLTFTRLVLPLSVPVVATFTIFQFLWLWNDLLVALVFLGTKVEVAVVTSMGKRGTCLPPALLSR